MNSATALRSRVLSLGPSWARFELSGRFAHIRVSGSRSATFAQPTFLPGVVPGAANPVAPPQRRIFVDELDSRRNMYLPFPAAAPPTSTLLRTAPPLTHSGSATIAASDSYIPSPSTPLPTPLPSLLPPPPPPTANHSSGTSLAIVPVSKKQSKVPPALLLESDEITIRSHYYEYQKLKLLLRAYHSETTDMLTSLTLLKDTLQPYKYSERRTGQPRIQWIAAALEQYWYIIRHHTKYVFEELDWHNPDHLDALRIALDSHILPAPKNGPTQHNYINLPRNAHFAVIEMKNERGKTQVH